MNEVMSIFFNHPAPLLALHLQMEIKKEKTFVYIEFHLKMEIKKENTLWNVENYN